MEMVRARLRIQGRVQGVFFRASTREQARRLGVRGNVRNLFNGDVEVNAEGERQAVESLIRWCHHGPSAARVTLVNITWESYKGEFDQFDVDY